MHPSFRARVTVAACLAAARTAVLTWVENDRTREVPDLIEQAFDALFRPDNSHGPRNPAQSRAHALVTTTLRKFPPAAGKT